MYQTTSHLTAPLLVAIFSAVVLLIATLFLQEQLVITQHQYEIQQLCGQARANSDPANGEAMRSGCLKAQHTYNMSFKCTSADSDASCWVEEN